MNQRKSILTRVLLNDLRPLVLDGAIETFDYYAAKNIRAENNLQVRDFRSRYFIRKGPLPGKVDLESLIDLGRLLQEIKRHVDDFCKANASRFPVKLEQTTRYSLLSQTEPFEYREHCIATSKSEILPSARVAEIAGISTLWTLRICVFPKSLVGRWVERVSYMIL